MAPNANIQILQKLEIFSKFTEEQLRLLAFGCQKLNFPANAELYHNNQISDGAYVILSGSVELTLNTVSGHHKTETFDAGSVLGELSMITRNRRIGTAVAKEDVEVLNISRGTLYRVIEEFPELAAVLYDYIAESVVKMGHELDPIITKLPPSA